MKRVVDYIFAGAFALQIVFVVFCIVQYIRLYPEYSIQADFGYFLYGATTAVLLIIAYIAYLGIRYALTKELPSRISWTPCLLMIAINLAYIYVPNFL